MNIIRAKVYFIDGYKNINSKDCFFMKTVGALLQEG